MDHSAETIDVEVQSAFDTDTWNSIKRGILFFPETADIPDGSTVTAASLFIYVTANSDVFGSQKLQVVAATPSSEEELVTGDFDQFGTTVLGEISLADVTVNAYNEIVLDTSVVNKTGTTILGLRLSKDVSNDSTWSAGIASTVSVGSMDHTNPSNRPFLTTSY